jgi:hypothetical protein
MKFVDLTGAYKWYSLWGIGAIGFIQLIQATMAPAILNIEIFGVTVNVILTFILAVLTGIGRLLKQGEDTVEEVK